MSLTGKLALVTGASRGIGRAIALKLAEAGATVLGSSTTENGAASFRDALKAQNLLGRGVVLNVADQESVDKLFSDMTKNEGMPHILVNNAGITADNLFIRMSIDEWSKVLDTNLTGIYRVMHACIRPMMKNRFGRIVNITSVVGVTGNAGQANYSAAKAGILGLTKSLAKELGSRGITINAVAPGFIDTDMTKALNTEQQEKLLEQIPLARMGSAEDIANAVHFLVSDAANYITGETLHVNGGMYMV
jgi:3-oxoacyl-[acyl-carrier protein] reductase